MPSPTPSLKPYQSPHLGGVKNHKPGCKCPPCTYARARREEAISEPAGGGGEALASKNVSPRKTTRFEKEFLAPPKGMIDVVVQDQTQRGRVAEWAALKSQGLTTSEIAQRFGISPHSLSTYIWKAAKAGWLKLDAPHDRLEYIIAPKVVDNIEHFIDEKSEKMTIAAANGIGLFQSHQAVKIEGEQKPSVLALKIEVIGAPTESIAGNVIGCPKILEGELVE